MIKGVKTWWSTLGVKGCKGDRSCPQAPMIAIRNLQRTGIATNMFIDMLAPLNRSTAQE